MSIVKNSNILIITLIVLIAVTGFSYLYFVNLTVGYTAYANLAKTEFTNLNSQYYGLEEEYLWLVSGITMEYAKSLGFVEKGERVFVSAKESVVRR